MAGVLGAETQQRGDLGAELNSLAGLDDGEIAWLDDDEALRGDIDLARRSSTSVEKGSSVFSESYASIRATTSDATGGRASGEITRKHLVRTDPWVQAAPPD